ncbi:MAG: YafY family transcriptional regulator [Lachnospiraceae bacterium]|nr:YafY family transcriptional regulator [Lachnospiraceae bacterium]
MKIDRLIGILSILLQEEKTTAPELAERFEVSKRTINRDIEDLCNAGIPICTTQGVGGGIRIMDGYKMDRTILTSKDMQMILAGLRSLDSVSGSSYCGQLMEKIQAGSSEFISGRDSILIDLSSWYRETLAPKIEFIQDAIEFGRRIRFHYYSPKGESEREIEPYYLIFKWSSWYVYGFCLDRKEFRTFKLNRMDKIVQSKSFERKRDVPMPGLSTDEIFPMRGRVKAVFEKTQKWRLIEDFGINSFSELPEGELLFEKEYADDEGLLSWLLTFADKVRVVEPEHIREKLVEITSKITDKYRKDKNNE